MCCYTLGVIIALRRVQPAALQYHIRHATGANVPECVAVLAFVGIRRQTRLHRGMARADTRDAVTSTVVLTLA